MPSIAFLFDDKPLALEGLQRLMNNTKADDSGANAQIICG